MKKKPVKPDGASRKYPANIERTIAMLAKMASKAVKWRKAVEEQQRKKETEDEQ